MRYATGAWATQLGGGSGVYAYQNGVWTKLLAPGHVAMMRLSDSNNTLSTLATWIVIKPDGSILSIIGTTTQGLQEAVTYSCTYGFDLNVHGGMVKAASSFGAYDGQDPSIINCSTGIVFPPMQMARISIRDVTLNFGGSVTVGVQLNSMLACTVDIAWGGQVVMSNVNACAILVKPQNQVPQDNLFGIGVGGTCHVRTGSLVVPTGGVGCCVRFDRSSGPIAFSNSWTFSEPNGGAVGIQVTDGAYAFTDNSIFAYAVHGQTSQCIQIGATNDGHTDLINGNKWWVDLHPATGGVGIDTWGTRDLFHVTINAGASIAAVGIKLEATADGNIFDVPLINGCTTKVQDLSTSKGNAIRTHRDHVHVNLNGVNQTGIATATYVKVAFSTVVSNTNGTWDAVNYRWTPGVPGLLQINAQVKWVATTDQAPLRTAVYKNGVQVIENIVYASGTGGGQGGAIGCTLRIDNGTDYIEIFAVQQTGVNQDISGDVHETWATFVRLGT
jgi:hypothetical protein